MSLEVDLIIYMLEMLEMWCAIEIRVCIACKMCIVCVYQSLFFYQHCTN